MSTIGERVEAWRIKAALSQTELANRAGINQETLRRIEEGDSKPYMRTVRKLAEALGVEPEALLRERVAPEEVAPPKAPEGSPYTLNVPDHLTLVSGLCLLVCRDHDGEEQIRYQTLGVLSFPALIGLLTLALDTHRKVALEQTIHFHEPAT